MALSNKTPLVGYGLTSREPKLEDVLNGFKTQILLSMFCHMPGKIVSYSYPTATVQILGQRVLKNGNTSPYPQLENVPVITLQGGGSALQFPIAAGDQCLVLFADRNKDVWLQNGGSQPPLDGRLHDISDGFALVGINWKGSTLIPAPSSTETRLILSDGTTKVGMKSGMITIQNASQNLTTILQNLVTALATLNTAIATMTTASIAAGTPQGVAAGQEATIAALITDLAALLY